MTTFKSGKKAKLQYGSLMLKEKHAKHQKKILV